jgi:hypothetical protein
MTIQIKANITSNIIRYIIQQIQIRFDNTDTGVNFRYSSKKTNYLPTFDENSVIIVIYATIVIRTQFRHE